MAAVAEVRTRARPAPVTIPLDVIDTGIAPDVSNGPVNAGHDNGHGAQGQECRLALPSTVSPVMTGSTSDSERPT